MSRRVVPVNEIDALNTNKCNFNQLNTFILNVTLLMCAPGIPQFCLTDFDNYVQVISYYKHVTVLLSSAAVTSSHPIMCNIKYACIYKKRDHSVCNISRRQ